MFGYIKPFIPELKVRESELYKSVYCGLCRTLKTRYGLLASFLVSYDMVFAAMLLAGEERIAIGKGRCVVSPFRKKCYTASFSALELAADATVINAYLKLDDDKQDEIGAKHLIACFLQKCILPWYKRAVKTQPILADETQRSFRLFSQLEKENCQSLDRMLDAMGRYACAMAYGLEKEKETILYHQARFITLMDALDDYDRDNKKKQYNVLHSRFGKMDVGTIKDLKIYLMLLGDSQQEAFRLLPRNAFSGIIENIITFGNESVSQKLMRKAEKEWSLE